MHVVLRNRIQDPELFLSPDPGAGMKIKLFAYYFLKAHLHHYAKIKSHKDVTEQLKSRFFLLFLIDEGRIRIRTNNG